MKLKRTLALLMALCMLIGIVPVVGISAEEYPAITPDKEQTVTISEGGEVAYFVFTPAYTESYTFYSVGEENSYTDTYGYLYDAEMNQLASNDDGAGNGNFSLNYTLEANTTYILGARYYSSSSVGSFAVMLKANHTCSEGVVAKEASCTEDGIMTYTCDVCGSEYAEAIPAGHTWAEGLYSCARCGEELHEEGTCGDNLTWRLDHNGTLTISGTGEMSDYSTGNQPWAEYADKITELVVQPGVTEIGRWTFSGCSNLKAVTLPDGISKIGYSVFSNCSSLSAINIPNSVISIEAHAFSSCSGLINIDLPYSLSNLGENAFYNCTALKAITIPEKITMISALVFSDCENLETVTMHDKVTVIDDYAFSSCSKLSDVTIPNGVTSIGEHAFAYCMALTKVAIPDTVTTIDRGAFGYCNNLSSINFKGDTPQLGTNVFANVIAEAFYPIDNETWTTDVMQNYGGNITWVAQYEMLDGDDSVVEMGNTPELEIRAAGEIEKFEGVTVDGELVDPSNYTVTEGSTIVAFKSEYLKTLEEGEHTIEVHFTDGVAIAEISVEKPAYVLGDVNGDGLVNSDDLTLLARHVGGIELVSGQALANSDVNGDGLVNSDDLTKHARYVGGIITNWDQE